MLPAEQRLKENQDFRTIYSRGRSFAHSLAVLYVMRRQGEAVEVASGRRIGFVVSKKQGNAVARNRIKRRLREAVRQALPDLKEGPFDLIFLARSSLRSAEWPEIQAAITELLRRADLFVSNIERPRMAEEMP
jgi:ribonuclease P protein component